MVLNFLVVCLIALFILFYILSFSIFRTLLLNFKIEEPDIPIESNSYVLVPVIACIHFGSIIM